MEDVKHYLENGAATAPAAREAIEWAGETRAQMVDLKFCDLLGTWQHMSLPIRALDESAFDDGLGFDGSSIRGWQGISESDMLLVPDPASAIVDPATEAPTPENVAKVLRTRYGERADEALRLYPAATHEQALQSATDLASDSFTARDIQFHFDAPSPEQNIKISAEVRREVFLIFKEAVNNIARHSGCKTAEVVLQIDRGVLTLKLSDDGIGFDVARGDHGQGLTSMRLRAEKLRGE